MGVPFVSATLRKVFGTRNERMVKRYLRVVQQVNSFAAAVGALSDEELRARTAEFRRRLAEGAKAFDILPEVFAVAREAMDRNVGIRNVFNPAERFDPQRLPPAARALYDDVQQQIAQTPPADPAGAFLGSRAPVPAWQFVDIPQPLYQAVRDLYPESRPPFRARPFDVQIIGALVLYEGKIAEMKTGEGKTIVAPLACYLAALDGRQVHVVTVNDYLVQRDRDWTFPFFRALGLRVGAIHPQHMQDHEGKQAAYACEVVYGTTAEFGFDYLRDNMKLTVEDQVQKRRDVAIVDEVDSILIDEARTPLIISGPAHAHSPRYDLADRLARHLVEKQREWAAADQKVQSCLVEISGLEGDIRNARDKAKLPALKQRMEAARARLPELERERSRFTQYFEVELDKKRATVTHEGVAEAQRTAEVGSFYVGENIDIPHLLEQSIRSHSVYQRDRDYVVAPDENGQMSVVIVDQNTGRKMIGRQWSDGLHQAIEAKEGVPIKQETQTMATITIQNFFKLYRRLSGMTGTADTEATEFYEIYRLDVVVIPTNLPMIRSDHDDVVYLGVKDKWDAIVDEIKSFHDVGRPILVGTTSVEKSEKLSEMLTRKHGIRHEVLNAKQHEREAEIIAHAGELGAVMISTNMAGRGTDIKLAAFGPEDLVEHWKRRGICPRDVTAQTPEADIVRAVYRHIAPRELGLAKAEIEALPDEELRLRLLRHWVERHCWISTGKAEGMSEPELRDALDQAGSFMLQRLRLFRNVEDLGGLHVVGTERHEARRIDNQLRGRSGRQGDKGSSRFFLSLEDDLMKMFAGPMTLRVLSKLGMKEGDAIEHPMLSRAVVRAQRKVEERNFLIRKNILEYDEPMDVQRGIFYRMRQDVLEGRNVKELIFRYIEEAVADAGKRYLDKGYAYKCIGEWVYEHLNVAIDAGRFRGKDREDLHQLIRMDALEESSSVIRVTLGEYMPEDTDAGEWDLKGLADWANATFDAGLTAARLREMTADDVAGHIEQCAEKKIRSADLAPLDQFLVASYGARELAAWANNRFGAEVSPEDFAGHENPDDAVAIVMERARAAYRRREIAYPIDFAIDITSVMLQRDPQQALVQFCSWVKARYELQWDPHFLPSADPRELRRLLLEEAQKWDQGRIDERAGRAVAVAKTPQDLDAWFERTANVRLTPEEMARAAEDLKGVAAAKIAALLRSELTQFERWVLLQILDQAWKDHLYQMDQVRESVGYRAFSQKDPRIEFKSEAGRLFEEMQKSIRDKVTDLVFKARLTPQLAPAAAPAPAAPAAPGAPARTAPAAPAPRPAQPAIAAAAAAAASTGTAAQRRDLAVAERAGADPRSKRQPARAAPAVGRNEPCPCGSGKKYKSCHGARK
jgi:preprotein translocase subunit SecA